ncbi:DNA/RNA nuclease SfsA [candidate division KSB1 bacterium]|nr:DNA/RNA nuclease SfsA [candidate division KSB1 bacterium]RQW07196.1 MAG: DNA/RNA nuclease SfsA [candidate division KSB1 bacterium]
MKNPPLIQGTLLKRYKRFLADIKLLNGKAITAACPNTGSMRSCSEPGSLVYLSKSDNPNRKYQYTWEFIFTNDTLVGINTQVPNKLVFRAVKKGQIPELANYDTIRKEVKLGTNSRIDLLLVNENERCYVEIKNVTLVEDGIARFPDAVTERGAKHVQELMNVAEKGHRAVMFYLVQRGDANLFRPAADIDPTYADLLKTAYAKGVEVLVYDADINLEEINIGKRLPIEL